MRGVDQIIERELLGGRTVAIPFVGSVRTVGYGVDIQGDHGAVAPWRSLTLDADFQDERSLVRILAHEFYAGDESAATNLYNSWLSQATIGQLLIIQGVGSISLDDFRLTIDPSMEFRLRPAGVNSLSLGRPMLKEQRIERARIAPRAALSRMGRGWVVFAVLMIVFAAVYVGYYFYINQ